MKSLLKNRVVSSESCYICEMYPHSVDLPIIFKSPSKLSGSCQIENIYFQILFHNSPSVKLLKLKVQKDGNVHSLPPLCNEVNIMSHLPKFGLGKRSNLAVCINHYHDRSR